MKTKARVLVSTKILAVALTATAGCAPPVGASSASSGPEHSELATVLVPPAPLVASAPPISEAAPQEAARPPADNPTLKALRDELAGVGRDGAMARAAHFRPLCDEGGYPLVGNAAARKGPSYAPSQFCAEVRGGARAGSSAAVTANED